MAAEYDLVVNEALCDFHTGRCDTRDTFLVFERFRGLRFKYRACRDVLLHTFIRVEDWGGEERSNSGHWTLRLNPKWWWSQWFP